METSKESVGEKRHREARGEDSEATEGATDSPDEGLPAAKKSRCERYLVEERLELEQGCEKWASASPAARKDMEVKALFANILRGNMKAVAQERGIPFNVMKELWVEWRETRQYQGSGERFHLPFTLNTNANFIHFTPHCRQIFSPRGGPACKQRGLQGGKNSKCNGRVQGKWEQNKSWKGGGMLEAVWRSEDVFLSCVEVGEGAPWAEVGWSGDQGARKVHPSHRGHGG